MTSKHLAVLRKAGAVVQSADGFTRFQNNIYPCPANPLWTSAIASSGWMRWSKLENILDGVTRNKSLPQEYKKFIDCFFALNNTGHAHFHALIIDTTQIDHSRFSGDKEVGFYKFYYQLLLHSFGGAYCKVKPDNRILVYLDYRNSSYSLNDLKSFSNMGMKKKFEIGTNPFHAVEPRDSKACQAIQITDVLIGAIGYKKNGFDLIAGANKGKKELSKYIESKSGLSDFTQSTPKRIQRFTIWNFLLKK